MSHEPETINVSYTNWRGETSVRRVILGNLRFGTTEWHEEPTWLISAFDLDHPAQIWKEFDLTKCDFNRNLSRATPTREQIMADERVQALVEALDDILDAADECDEWRSEDFQQAPVTAETCRAIRTALAALTESP